MSRGESTLILAWGNPGRIDDGLGPALADRLSGERLPDLVVESDYQLQIEHAEVLSRFRRVLFVDADRVGPGPFRVERGLPDPKGVGFSTHSVSPGVVLALAQEIFDAEPEAWVVGIRGYEFDEFGEWLSTPAQRNLDRAVSYLREWLVDDGVMAVSPSTTQGDAA